MEALLNVFLALFPLPEGITPVELAPAALMIAGFIAVTVFGFAMSLYDSWKEHRS
jgi:hypothetical protein